MTREMKVRLTSNYSFKQPHTECCAGESHTLRPKSSTRSLMHFSLYSHEVFV